MRPAPRPLRLLASSSLFAERVRRQLSIPLPPLPMSSPISPHFLTCSPAPTHPHPHIHTPCLRPPTTRSTTGSRNGRYSSQVPARRTTWARAPESEYDTRDGVVQVSVGTGSLAGPGDFRRWAADTRWGWVASQFTLKPDVQWELQIDAAGLGKLSCN